MKKLVNYHTLFGATLIALTALGAWWLVFFIRSVELERTTRLNELVHASVVTALTLGHDEIPPHPGSIPDQPSLEIVSTSDCKTADLCAPVVPEYPELSVRPTPPVLEAIEAKMHRRRVMLIGEGGLLLLLLGVSTFMLYRMVQQERSHIRKMEDFVAAVTHEMKTPLTGLISMLQTFVDGRVPPEKKDQIYALGLKEAERLEHMIENVLISGRLRTEHYQVQPEKIQLHSFLDRFVQHRRRYLITRPDSLSLIWRPKSPEIELLGDPQAIQVILENLVDNAFKYGGATPEVTIQVETDDHQTTITVEDRGIGFSIESAEELFSPFHRAIGKKSTIQHGTGLGLSIARTLARQMNGDLKAWSEGPGKGSRFILFLKRTNA